MLTANERHHMTRAAIILPLQWPKDAHGRPWPRNHAPKESRFSSDITVTQAARALHAQCRLVTGCAEASIRITGGDGTSNPSAHVDHGASVFFTSLAGPVGFGADQYRRVAHNLWALAKHIECMRSIERWGVGTSQQAFAGYATALHPASTSPTISNWRSVLGLFNGATVEEITARYRELAHKYHPDKGGSPEIMKTINAARDAALREVAP